MNIQSELIDEHFVTGFVAGAATVLIVLVVFGLGYLIVSPWIRLKLCGGRGSLLSVLAMRLRGNPVSLIIDAYTALIQSSIDVSLREVESQFVANRGSITDMRDLVEHVREHKRCESFARQRQTEKEET